MSRPRLSTVLAAGALALAGLAGALAAAAISNAQSDPARTVTVDVGTGERGPAGPPGPAGLECPSAYEPGVLQINAPGGQVRIWTCLTR
jgi:hypothetical protein